MRPPTESIGLARVLLRTELRPRRDREGCVACWRRRVDRPERRPWGRGARVDEPLARPHRAVATCGDHVGEARIVAATAEPVGLEEAPVREPPGERALPGAVLVL